MMIGGTGRFEGAKVQMLGQLDEQMVRVAFEQLRVRLVTQPDEQFGKVHLYDRQRKLGYIGQGGLFCAKSYWAEPQSLHILRPSASPGLGQFVEFCNTLHLGV